MTVLTELRRRYPRLPSGPLLEAVRAERAARNVGVRRFLTPTQLRAYKLAKAEGSVTTYQIERLCAAINRCPREVYRDAYDAAVSKADQVQVEVASPAFQRLPAKPLVEAIEARLRRLAGRLTPLTDPGTARGEALREAFGGDERLKRAFYRARQRGWVLLLAAEQLCDVFGWHPRELWGDRYDAAALAGTSEDLDPWQGVA